MIKNGIVHKGAPKCIKPNYNNKKRILSIIRRNISKIITQNENKEYDY